MSALTKISLLGLLCVGGATLHGLSISTGYYDLIEDYKAKAILHDGTPYNTKITGLEVVDDFLGVLVQFFLPCADGSDPGASLQSLLFTTQFVPFLIIWLVEGHRAGNRGKLISYTTVYGLLCQGGGVGMISPLYLLLYVFTSPTVTNPTAANLIVDPAISSGIPYAFGLGFLAPTIFMSLPAPKLISLETKIKALSAWQPFPVYIAIVLQIWKAFSAESGASMSTFEQKRSLRKVYKFALMLSVPAHAIVWGFSLGALFFPHMFTRSIARAFHPLNAIIPANPFEYAKQHVPSMTKGALNFLQWDYLTSSAAYLIFSLNARFNRQVEPRGFSAAALVGLLPRLAVLGPMGTALSYLWERDEIVLGCGHLKKE